METVALNNHNTISKIQPQKFALWIAMAGIIMMFAALTSAYIVKKAAGDWLDFPLPPVFYYSTLAMVLSSVTIQWSNYAYRRQHYRGYMAGLILTMALGLAFVIMQYQGWQELFRMGITINANVSGSFFYIISGLHATHVLGGLAVLVVALVHAISLPFRYTSRRHLRLDLTTQYWHFVDILWLYLFFFLLIQ